MVKTLFTNIEEIQDYITVDISSNFKTIAPYIRQAQKYTIEITGKALHADLLALVENKKDDEKLKDLLKFVRLPLANFGYFLAIAKLNVNVGEKGFTVTQNQNLAPASEWRVKEFRESVELTGNDALEDLLEYLEENHNHFPKWTQSKAYSFNKQFFINNASEFNQAIKTDITRINFLSLKPFIHQIERSEILKAIGPGLFKEIKEQIKLSKVLPDNNILLEDYIRPAICYLSLDKFAPDGNENAKLEGIRYIKEMRDYLNTNANKYPEYKLSDCYEDPAIENIQINNEDSGLFVGGIY